MAERKGFNSSDQEERDLETGMDYDMDDISAEETADETFPGVAEIPDIVVSPPTPEVDLDDDGTVNRESCGLTHSASNSGSTQENSNWDLFHHSESDDRVVELGRNIDEFYENSYRGCVYSEIQLEILLRLLLNALLIALLRYLLEESQSMDENMGEERYLNRSATEVSDWMTIGRQQMYDNVEEHARGKVSVIQDGEPWNMNISDSISEDGENMDEQPYSYGDMEMLEEQDINFDLSTVELHFGLTRLVIQWGRPLDINIQGMTNEDEEVMDDDLYSDGDYAEYPRVKDINRVNVEHTGIPNSFIEDEDPRDLNLRDSLSEEEEDDFYSDSDFAEYCRVQELNRINLEHTRISNMFIKDEASRDIIYDMMFEVEEQDSDLFERYGVTESNRSNGEHEEGNSYSYVDPAEKSKESGNDNLNAVSAYTGIPNLVYRHKEPCDINIDYSIKEDEDGKSNVNGSHSNVEPTEKSDQVKENEENEENEVKKMK